MKTIKITTESRAYTEQEAKDFIEKFRSEANEKGYIVSAAGYTYKTKKKNKEVVAEAWICKCIAQYNDIWEEDE